MAWGEGVGRTVEAGRRKGSPGGHSDHTPTTYSYTQLKYSNESGGSAQKCTLPQTSTKESGNRATERFLFAYFGVSWPSPGALGASWAYFIDRFNHISQSYWCKRGAFLPACSRFIRSRTLRRRMKLDGGSTFSFRHWARRLQATRSCACDFPACNFPTSHLFPFPNLSVFLDRPFPIFLLRS